MLKLWDHKENLAATGRAPEDIYAGASEIIKEQQPWWNCGDHIYRQPTSMVKRALKGGNTGCPYCSGKLPAPSNWLANIPEIADSLHPTHEGNRDETGKQLTAQDIMAHSNKIYWWLCSHGHEWDAKPNDRVTDMSGCPDCDVSGTSKVNYILKAELASVFQEIDSNQEQIAGLEGNSRLNKLNYDVVIPSIKVAVEYDSTYFHRNEDLFGRKKELRRASAKRDQARTVGYEVIRIREGGIEITDPEWDIEVDRVYSNYKDDKSRKALKQTIDKLLIKILDMIPELNHDHKNRIDWYLAQSEPQNQKTGEAWILSKFKKPATISAP